MNIQVRIVEGPLPPSEPWDIPGAGAVVNFAGIVRPAEEGKTIKGLHYEAYRPMAEQQIEKIARELMESHKLLGMRIVHSVGWVAAGECSFRLDVAAPRRVAAFLAMTEFIDRLKRDVPIWKDAR
jgi:molybdopterin synthase catalytic subunit